LYPANRSTSEEGDHDEDPGVLDKSGLWARIGGDGEVLKTLVDAFLEVTPETLKKIREAVAGRDAKAVERAAQHLKGSLGTLSASNALRIAEDLEQVARSGNLAPAPDLAQTLEQDVALVREALQEMVLETEKL
jgi:HPt (histidine-containing phosphotransfer) domain-containing protein